MIAGIAAEGRVAGSRTDTTSYPASSPMRFAYEPNATLVIVDLFAGRCDAEADRASRTRALLRIAERNAHRLAHGLAFEIRGPRPRK